MCEEMKELISLYIDDELTAEKNEETAEHLKSCAECKAYYTQLKEIISGLSKLPLLEPPEDFHIETMKKLKTENFLNNKKSAPRMKKTFKPPKGYLPIGKNIIGSLARYASVAAGLLFAVTLVSVIGSSLFKTSHSIDSGDSAAEMRLHSLDANTHESLNQPLNESAATGAEETDLEIQSFMTGARLDAAAFKEPAKNTVADSGEITVKSYYINLDVEDFDFAATAINGLNGSTLNSSLNTNYIGERSAYYEIKFSEVDYDQAIDIILSLGKVLDQSGSAEVLRYDYQDAQAKLTAKELERQRLLELFSRTDTMANMIMLERRLIEVENETDMYKASLASYIQRAKNPLVRVQLNESKSEALVLNQETFGSRVKSSFISSVNGTAIFLESLLVFSAGGLIPIIILALFIFGVFDAIKRIARRRRSGEK